MDMVTMNIVDSTMVSICREMGILLMKTSYPTIFNEGLDFICALADDKGDMIACAEEDVREGYVSPARAGRDYGYDPKAP